MFEQFFVGKATERLLGARIRAEHLNDDRLSRALDTVWEAGLSELFTAIAMRAYRHFGLSAQSLHLESSSFSVTGDYPASSKESIKTISITYDYSKDHRPDLKQFLGDLICTSDGAVPLFLQVGDGNESDSAVIAKFPQLWTLESIYVADAALYSRENLQAWHHSSG
ncbi:MAG: IS1634 family transposase [Cyanobacteria bacterium P01_C01_bin.70]